MVAMLDISALQELMNGNNTALADAMAAYFNGSKNATEAFKLLDPATAATITTLLNGTDLSAFMTPANLTGSGSSGSGMANLTTPAPAPFSMPPLPRPGIFDAPSNPYLDGLDETLAQLTAGLTPEQRSQTVMLLYREMIDAAKKKSFEITMLLLLGYALVFLFSAVLIIHIRYNRHLATKGDSTAARKIVLPAFEPMLWTYCWILVVYIAFFSATIRADFMTVQSTFVTIEFAYSCKQVLYLLVPIYMLQKSLSVPALMRAIGITLVASCYTIPICWVMQEYGTEANGQAYYWILWGSRWATFLPAIYVCTWPPARSSKRAFQECLAFYVVVQALYFSACEVFRQGGSIDLGTRFGWASACWVGVYPLVIWRIIKADTEHWRGIGKRAVELQTLFRRKGLVEERISAKGLHVLIEMHRKLIIDFANLDIQHKIAEGANSIVFRGRLNAKQQAVAIKVYTPSNVSEDVVAEFSHEAALCGALTHPNILKFHGMCVCPPTICFVTELCQGSLHDITVAMAKKRALLPHRQQFLLNMGYMLDAARSIAYLHSFSPPYVHRDIRPSSFLVDMEGSVKLTDFGASRTLSVRNAASLAPTVTAGTNQATVLTAMDAKRMPEYMAPEVIRSKHAGAAMYGEAADIYALAMTMWDILYPGVPKFGGSSTGTRTTTNSSSNEERDSYNQRESEVFDRVFAGQRPPLDEHVYPPLRELIASAWHADPRVRPRAHQIVRALELIQEETCAVYAHELVDELDCATVTRHGAGISPVLDVSQISFQGARAIERMYAMQHVSAEFEAVRLGNMLMDAGFLHHVKHVRSFEYSAALYYFDEEQIALCQPLAMLEDGGGPSSSKAQVATANGTSKKRGASKPSRRATATGRTSVASSDHAPHAHVVTGTAMACACRKLGQKDASVQPTLSRLRLRFKSTDENQVTARLLADEPNLDFEAFHDPHGTQDGGNTGRVQ